MVQTKSYDTLAIQAYDDRSNPLTALDSDLEISLGNQPGRSNLRKFGFNTGLILSAFETVWSPGGVIDFLSAGEIMNVVSTDANDTFGGTGTEVVLLQGVDQNFEAVQEVVIMAGLTPVATVNSFWVVNHVFQLQTGSNKKNVGIITATAAVSATLQAEMPVGYGTTQQVFIAMPVGHGSTIMHFELTGTKLVGGAKPVITARVVLHELLDLAGMQTIVFEEAFDTAVTNRTEDGTVRGAGVGGGQVLELQALSDVTNAAVYARVAYKRVENSQRGFSSD